LNLVERLVFGFEVRGRERVPTEGPVIVASNHISYCDPPVVGSGVQREVYFMAKEELFRNPVFGRLIRSYNAIPLRRGVGDMAAMKRVVRLLRREKAVLMFPEGTRSLSGRLLKAKPGVGMIAAMTGAPVVPAYVTGTNRLGKAFLRQAPLRVAFAPPVDPAELCGGPRDREGYARVTGEIMRRIQGLAEEENQRP
jgi:1-acyl-sn-glycerol-3-phosphate acyltransferase